MGKKTIQQVCHRDRRSPRNEQFDRGAGKRKPWTSSAEREKGKES